MEQRLKQNIILIGFMGSGKTTVGKRLAQRISYQFYDTDYLLETKQEMSISRIFELYGEEYFRDMETKLLRELVKDTDRTILSTGGGMPLREENAKLMKELGHIVYLKASKETIVKRLMGDTSRPLLRGEELPLKVEKMLGIRAPIYERNATQVVTTDDKTVDELVDSILEVYQAQY